MTLQEHKGGRLATEKTSHTKIIDRAFNYYIVCQNIIGQLLGNG